MMDAGKLTHSCSSCSTEGAVNSCSRCKKVWYCNSECQLAHWKAGHKQACVATTAATPVKKNHDARPLVSVLTPTYNRRRFIPWLIECFKAQEYPQEKMEWIILDDGTDKVGDLFAASGLTNVRYYAEDIKLNIGAKRNKLNVLAKGEICVCMDDDDYYPPERVKHVVVKLNSQPKYQICGSSELYMFYSDNKQIYRIGPYSPNHATNGTMGYRRSYFQNHKYDETVTHAEETSFLNAYKEPMLQLDPMKVMLVMSHSENTFDKKKLRDKANPMFKLTGMKIKDFIRDSRLRDFYLDS
jgi:glycosyltransferase involved in cell wall biosynthesis